MEPTTLFYRFAKFLKESYTQRIKQSGSGILMGFIGAQHLLFAGTLANLVGPLWWAIKGAGTVALAFFSSLATSYGAYLIEKYKDKKRGRPSPTKNGKKNKAA